MGPMKQDLTATLTSLRLALAYDYRIVPMDVTGSPVFMAVALPLAAEVTGQKPRLPSGRGLSMPQAMVSAGAEALELRSSLASSNLGRIARLPRQDGRAMIEARELRCGGVVPVSAQTVFLDLAAATGEPLDTDARSTGCATAPDRQTATEQALLECIERDAIAFWWHGGVAAHALPLDILDTFAPRLLWWLQTRARQTRLLGLISETGVPVVIAVSSDAGGRNVAHGAAARFSGGDACLAAVTELVQTEAAFAMALSAGNDEARAWQDHASTLIQPQFNPDEDGPPPLWTTHDGEALLDRLEALGLAALSVDLTLPGDPLPTIRVLVPGLCDMGARIDEPRFRRHAGIVGSNRQPIRHQPEPF